MRDKKLLLHRIRLALADHSFTVWHVIKFIVRPAQLLKTGDGDLHFLVIHDIDPVDNPFGNFAGLFDSLPVWKGISKLRELAQGVILLRGKKQP